MHFKRLELIGFKSFAEKTEVIFEPGVTAIVGPNGCGKSNISDSIRWVLGEQSAKSLRGSSMEDVIFNGTASKEPLNFAEVSLTLSNEARILPIDYDEVTISRRLYRSGESEYLVNKNIVRLKDIHEMLLGTGIGTESYSIIEQGKMDMVLNSKPEDRRSIFEEAAGITKFKSKKKEALRKLEQTDNNLVRIHDIIQEVRRQIGSIERQAKKAESYKQEFERLKQMEMSMAVREFRQLSAKLAGADAEIDNTRSEEDTAMGRVHETEEIYRAKKSELDELDLKLKNSQTDEIVTTGDIRSSEDKVLLNRERIGELMERRETLARQIETSRRRAEEFRVEFDNLNSEFEKLQREEIEGQEFLLSVEKLFAELEGLLSASLAKDAVQKARLMEVASVRARRQTELAKIRAEWMALQHRLQRLTDEHNQLQRDRDNTDRERQFSFSQTTEREAALKGLEDTRAAREDELRAERERIESLKQDLNEIFVRESRLVSQLTFLTDLKSKNEGLLGGVKALLAERDNSEKIHGLVGVLADLVSVETGYELAVEAALENYLQAVVFDSDAAVLRAADFLRSSHKGRALLISLEVDDSRPSPPAPEGTMPVRQSLHPNEAARLLIDRIVNGVFVAATPEKAFELARRHPDLVFVTKSGERFEGRVVMGGSLSTDASSSLVGRDSRIQQCETELTEVRHIKDNTESSLRARQTRETELQSEIDRAQADVEAVGRTLSDERVALRVLEERLQKFSDNLETIRLETAQIANQSDEHKAAETVTAAEFDALNAEETSIAQALSDEEAFRSQKTTEKEALLVRLAETRSKQDSCVARREKLERDRNWAMESKTNEEGLIVTYEAQIAEITGKKESLEDESRSLEEELSLLREKKDELVRLIQTVRLEREAIAAELLVIETEKSEKEKFLQSSKDRIHALEMNRANVAFEIDRLTERISTAYQADLARVAAEAPSEEDAGQDAESIKASILAIREKLQRMGPVNLVAIEEHKELHERFEFLTKQEQDLIQAKEDLHKTIQKINRTTRELFTETFETTRKHFSTYFKQLFGGGVADLVLLDDQDVLESGIEIVARPPGKKLQSITLLSGGEKALTAVALMFALFKVRPSPFCILDELDAPLDESNVERFCNVLREFTVGSQFILITHNKRTMHLADAMYGITMAESGISRVVSVKFGDKNFERPGEKSRLAVTADKP